MLGQWKDLIYPQRLLSSRSAFMIVVLMVMCPLVRTAPLNTVVLLVPSRQDYQMARTIIVQRPRKAGMNRNASIIPMWISKPLIHAASGALRSLILLLSLLLLEMTVAPYSWSVWSVICLSLTLSNFLCLTTRGTCSTKTLLVLSPSALGALCFRWCTML